VGVSDSSFIIHHSSLVKMQILDDRQIRQKIRRLAIEILEHNHGEPEIILAGINNKGIAFARLLHDELRARPGSPAIHITSLRLNPADPLASEVQLEMPIEALSGKVVIVVDDVANTGRTIFYACKPILQTLPKKVEVAVMVDRTHKSFPVKVDYYGLSLATTLLEDIDVQLPENEAFGVYLD
jgi:pyrimidine operon attenuation protein/uracil phosphoribosyltransferase